MAGNAVKAMMRRVALIKPVEAGAASGWVVQLGAYDSAAVAKERWQGMARSNAKLAAFPVSNTTITVNGQLFHRLAISGFGDRSAARQMCRSIRANRGQCFIREGVPGSKPERWAAAKPKQFASR
jgi:cell division septation protein DedD